MQNTGGYFFYNYASSLTESQKIKISQILQFAIGLFE